MTSSELIQVLYDRLIVSPLKTALTGNIWKGERPENSTKEDAVINALPVTNSQLQEGFLNLNVFVPPVTVTINSTPQPKPNTAREAQLEQLATEAINDVVVKVNNHTVQYNWQQAYVLKDDATGQRYINIRVQFYITNI